MKSASDSVRRAQPWLGTFVEVAVSGALPADPHAAIDRAFQAVADVHRLMSFHEPASDVSRVNREAAKSPVRVHPWTYQVLQLASELYAASAGLFDISVADALQHLGLLPCCGAEARPTSITRTRNQPVELLPRLGVRLTHPSVRIDLGGIAKGFAVDRAVEILQACGMPRGLVNAGGDLAVFGPEAFSVHIRDPRGLGQLLQVEVQNEAIASSGGAVNQSSEAMETAIIDPGTRRPARAVLGATVRAPYCVIADALTKLVILARESAAGLLARYGASALVVPCSGDMFVTRTWSEGPAYRPSPAPLVCPDSKRC
jgi:thiamine biosynthesis lipoprotein